jgi:hypothetical protein
MTALRTVAYWIGVALLVAVSAFGLWSSIESLGSDTTTGQRVATFTQFGYALGGFAAATGLVTRRAWARTALWLWAALITLTGGLAPVVWGGSGPGTGLAAGAVSVAIAGLVILLATRRRTATTEAPALL